MNQNSKEENKAYEAANEVFSKSFLVLLAHCKRKLNDNPEYDFPPFLNAFMLAVEASNEKPKDNENYSGVSFSKDKREGYMVIIKKRKQGFEIQEFVDLAINRPIPIHNVIKLIELSIRFDNLEGDLIETNKAVDYLNKTLSEIEVIRFPNNQWKKYRSKVIKMNDNGQLHPSVISQEDLENLSKAKNFGEVPNKIRSLIASLYSQDKSSNKKAMGLSSPDNKIQKFKMWEMAKQMLYGEPSDYYNKNSKS